MKITEIHDTTEDQYNYMKDLPSPFEKKKLDNLGDFETRVIQYTKIAIGIIGLILFSVFLFK